MTHWIDAHSDALLKLANEALAEFDERASCLPVMDWLCPCQDCKRLTSTQSCSPRCLQCAHEREPLLAQALISLVARVKELELERDRIVVIARRRAEQLAESQVRIEGLKVELHEADEFVVRIAELEDEKQDMRAAIQGLGGA